MDKSIDSKIIRIKHIMMGGQSRSLVGQLKVRIFIIAVFFALFFVGTATIARAFVWSDPGDYPPNGNIAGPVNFDTNITGDIGKDADNSAFDDGGGKLTLKLKACGDGQILKYSAASKLYTCSDFNLVDSSGWKTLGLNVYLATSTSLVGIGVSDPQDTLSVYRNDNNKDAAISLQSGNGATVQDKWTMYNAGINSGDGSLRFWNGTDAGSGSDRFWITKDAKLEVAGGGDVCISGGNCLSTINSGGYWSRDNSNGYTYLTTSTDKVGLGISVPDDKLTVSGNIHLLSGGVSTTGALPSGSAIFNAGNAYAKDTTGWAMGYKLYQGLTGRAMYSMMSNFVPTTNLTTANQYGMLFIPVIGAVDAGNPYGLAAGSFNINLMTSLFARLDTATDYAGNIGEARMLHIQKPNVKGGSISNATGLYISDFAGGSSNTPYAIKQLGANDLVYLNGLVGIGISTPNSQLHVYKPSGNNAEIDIQSNSGTANHWAIYNDRLAATDNLIFWKNNANRFWLTPGGKAYVSSTGDFCISGGNCLSSMGGDGYWSRDNAAGKVFLTTSTDMVGIGSSTPNTALVIAGSGVNSGKTSLTLSNTASAAGGKNYTLSSGIYMTSEGGFSIRDNSSATIPFAIDSNGFVGIGGFGGLGSATFPEKFTINGGAIALKNFDTIGNDVTYPKISYRNYGDGSGSGISIRAWKVAINAGDQNDTSAKLFVNNNGNIGMGTSTPNSLLHLFRATGNNAEIDIQSNAGLNNHWAIYNNRVSDSLVFWKNNKDLAVLTSDGKIGIGTTTPNASLQVVDYINFGSNLGTAADDGNTNLGFQAGKNSIAASAAKNTFVGYQAALKNTSGQYNTSIGNQSLYNSISAVGNTAVGGVALYSNLYGGFNTAVGLSALGKNSNGINNVAVGAFALNAASYTGSNNTALGAYSLQNATGNDNVGIGYYSGYYETNGGSFYLNNRNLTNAADEKKLSLMYGNFGTATSTDKSNFGQQLFINGNLGLNVSPTATTLLGAMLTIGDGVSDNDFINFNGNAATSSHIGMQISKNGNYKWFVGEFDGSFRVLDSGWEDVLSIDGSTKVLTINQGLKIVGGQASGYVLTSDSQGNASWKPEINSFAAGSVRCQPISAVNAADVLMACDKTGEMEGYSFKPLNSVGNTYNLICPPSFPYMISAGGSCPTSSIKESRLVYGTTTTWRLGCSVAEVPNNITITCSK